jgi:L-fuculose-phosphate aldolase
MAIEQSLAEQVAWACRMLAMGGHGDFTLGHASARLGADQLLMKPNKIGLEEVRPEDVLTLDMQGERISGEGPIHLEAVLHTSVYRARPDVGAVIHTHPKFATAFGATDASLEMINHDAVLFQQGLAFFDQTAELIVRDDQASDVTAALGDRNVLIMRGHGVLITGKTLQWAVYTALTLERVIEIQSIARTLGNLAPMTPNMAERVYPDKYRDEYLDTYWQYLMRQTARAGLAGGLPWPTGMREV